MAVYSIKEISELIGKPAKSVEVYVTRHKLIKNKAKKIDSSNPINAVFLAKYLKSEINETDKPISENSETNINPQTNEINSSALAMVEVEYTIKKLQAQKLQKEIIERDLKIAQSNGTLVNAEKTISIVSAYAKSLKNNMKSSLQLKIRDICTQNNISPEKTGKYISEVVGLINSASDTSIEILEKEFGYE